MRWTSPGRALSISGCRRRPNRTRCAKSCRPGRHLACGLPTGSGCWWNLSLPTRPVRCMWAMDGRLRSATPCATCWPPRVGRSTASFITTTQACKSTPWAAAPICAPPVANPATPPGPRPLTRVTTSRILPTTFWPEKRLPPTTAASPPVATYRTWTVCANSPWPICAASRTWICGPLACALTTTTWSPASTPAGGWTLRCRPCRPQAPPLRKTARCGCAPPTTATTKTGSCAKATAATPISCPTWPTTWPNGSAALPRSSTSKARITTAPSRGFAPVYKRLPRSKGWVFQWDTPTTCCTPWCGWCAVVRR